MKLKNILLCASVLGGLALSSCTGNFLDEDILHQQPSDQLLRL